MPGECADGWGWLKVPIFTRNHSDKLPLPLMSLAAGLNVQLITHTGEPDVLKGKVVCFYLENRGRWAISMDITKPGFADEALRMLREEVSKGPAERFVPAPCARPDPRSETDFASALGFVMQHLLCRKN